MIQAALGPEFGKEIEISSNAELLSSAVLLRRMLAEHRLLLMRNIPCQLGVQLRISSLVGRLVAGPGAVSRRLKALPDVRVESSKPHPTTGHTQTDAYSHYWHSDLSWAERPADYTLLLALDMADQAEATAIADTVGGYAALPESLRKRIDNWKAYHHVSRSRAIRSERSQQRSQSKSVADEWQSRGRAYKLWIAARFPSSPPRAIDPMGSVHDVVQHERSSGKPYVYLGDHAWSLVGFDEKQGMIEINNLNRCITLSENVYTHQWRQGDLLIIDNRSLLHRRVPSMANGWRTLRRTLVWQPE